MTGDQASSPRQVLTEGQKQRVLDAAALLQVRRSEVAAALARGATSEAEVIASGTPQMQNEGLAALFDLWRELHATRPWASVNALRFSLPNNRRLLEGGLRMESIFDPHGLSLGGLILIANETLGDYLVGFAPLNMKIVNRDHVLLQGPVVDGTDSVMAVRSGACLEAAWRYWNAVREHAIPAAEWASTSVDLTRRQRQVVALMSTGLGDDAIASALDVSVRTVRADIAALMEQLGVRTRFAAGVRLQLWPDAGE